MFLPNKYYRWYCLIIDRARLRGPINDYTERHHVVPKSMGGLDDKSNLVCLTFREHFLAHWLLTKCTEGAFKSHALHAFFCMGWGRLKSRRSVSSWRVVLAKRAGRDARNSVEARLAVSKRHSGKVTSKETKQKMREAQLGKSVSMEARLKISASLKGHKIWVGKKHKDESKKKMSARKLGRSLSPEHCAKLSEIRIGKPVNAGLAALFGKVWLGRKHSQESKEKMSSSQRRRKRGPLSPAHRAKLSANKTAYYEKQRALKCQ